MERHRSPNNIGKPPRYLSGLITEKICKRIPISAGTVCIWVIIPISPAASVAAHMWHDPVGCRLFTDRIIVKQIFSSVFVPIELFPINYPLCGVFLSSDFSGISLNISLNIAPSLSLYSFYSLQFFPNNEIRRLSRSRSVSWWHTDNSSCKWTNNCGNLTRPLISTSRCPTKKAPPRHRGTDRLLHLEMKIKIIFQLFEHLSRFFFVSFFLHKIGQ